MCVYVYKYTDTEYISGIHCQSADYMLSSPAVMRTVRKIYWGDERCLMNRCLWRIWGEWIAKNFQGNSGALLDECTWYIHILNKGWFSPCRDDVLQKLPKGSKRDLEQTLFQQNLKKKKAPMWFKVTFLSPNVGGHQQPLISGHVNSPSQKGHQQNCPDSAFHFLLFNLEQKSIKNWMGPYQRTPKYVAIKLLVTRYSGWGVRSVGAVGDFLEERLHDFPSTLQRWEAWKPSPSPFHQLLVCTQASGRYHQYSSK